MRDGPRWTSRLLTSVRAVFTSYPCPMTPILEPKYASSKRKGRVAFWLARLANARSRNCNKSTGPDPTNTNRSQKIMKYCKTPPHAAASRPRHSGGYARHLRGKLRTTRQRPARNSGGYARRIRGVAWRLRGVCVASTSHPWHTGGDARSWENLWRKYSSKIPRRQRERRARQVHNTDADDAPCTTAKTTGLTTHCPGPQRPQC